MQRARCPRSGGYNLTVKRLATVLLFAIAAPLSAQSSLQFYGFATAREIFVKAQPSWSTGGFGRFDVGADNSNDKAWVFVGNAQLGLDWTPSTWFLLHADGIARKQQTGTVGDQFGLIQAFMDFRTQQVFRLRIGQFWLPTSRENIDPLWTSPYTITYSAWNSWMGQEVRPIGADLQISPSFYFSLGGTAFIGNDTMGTGLAAHGWTFGSRLSAYNEVIAAAPATTRPFGTDLDHKIGDSERIRLQMPERAMIQYTRVDNRSTIGSGGKPPNDPWHTHFDLVSASAGENTPTTLAGEWARGETTVGFPGGTFTLPFDTVYLLLSQKNGTDRWTARAEQFRAGKNKGHAYTIAWMRDTNKTLRTGVEYAYVTGDQSTAPDPKTGGSTITVELRYRFQ